MTMAPCAVAGDALTDSSGLRAAFLPLPPAAAGAGLLQEAHFKQIQLQGFTLVPAALEPAVLTACRSCFDAAVAAHRRQPESTDEDDVGIFLDPAVNPLFATL
jgi:hypothetical protein